MIALADDGYRALGLTGFRLRAHLARLTRRAARPTASCCRRSCAGLDLDEATRQRAALNPLRVLDDKRPEVQAQLADAPLMIDHLCDDCAAPLRRGPRRCSTRPASRYVVDPRLVRGLDYYTRTTFEFVHDGLGAQSGIGGGGRYDGLMRRARRPAAVRHRLRRSASTAPCSRCRPRALDAGTPSAPCDVYVVPLGEARAPCRLSLVTELRRAGVRADLAYGGRGLKGAMKGADRSGAAFAVVARRPRPRGRRGAGQGPGHRRADGGTARTTSSSHLIQRLKELHP